MKRSSILFSGVMLAVGLGYAFMAWKMPRGSMAQPGPGFFPIGVGVFWIATALGCLLQDIRNRKTDAPHRKAPSSAAAASVRSPFGKTFQLTALMIAYILALTPLGFPVAICVFLVVSTRIFGSRSWGAALAIAAMITTLTYLTFVVWLKVPLPLGILEEFLG